MKASDIMTVGAAMVHPDTKVSNAARVMLQHHISGLPVIDDDGMLVGMVTERDLLRRAELGTEHARRRWLEFLLSTGDLAAEYVHAHGRKVEDVMTSEVVSVTTDTPLADVVDLMERHGFKRLPVVRDGKVIGIVSRANFLAALSRRMGEAPPATADDRAIRARILDELHAQSWDPGAAVDVHVQEGVVELRGTVTDERVRDAVYVAAENVTGVKEVNDHLQIIPFTPGWV